MDILIVAAAKKISENYAFQVSKLLKDLEAATRLSKIRKIFFNFRQKFTMIPQLWEKWMELEKRQTFPDFEATNFRKKLATIKAKAKKDFRNFNFLRYNSDQWKKGCFEEQMFFNHRDLANFQIFSRRQPTTASQTFENALKFPHHLLHRTKIWCEKYGTRPFPNDVLQKYNSATKIWHLLFETTIYLADDWMSNLVALNDRHYIIRSFEQCIHYIPDEIERWESYIKYLHKIDNKKALLNVYSRYCRLFTDDLRMRKTYIEFVKKNMPEFLCFWGISGVEKKLFIQYFGKIPDTLFPKKLPEIEFEKAEPQISNLNCLIDSTAPSSPHRFSPENSVQQQFSLPFDVMNFIIAKCNFVTKQMLYQCCKSFYQKSFQKPLCHRLGIFDNSVSTYFEQSLFLNSNTFFCFGGLEGIILTNMLQIVLTQNPNATSIILSKISECQILHLQLQNQNLTKSEFDVLVGERTQTLYFDNVLIRDKCRILAVDEVIEKVPNAYDIVIKPSSPVMYTKKTAENLANLRRSKNLMYLLLASIPQGFQEDCFFLFLRNSALHKATIQISLAADVTDEFKESFKGKIEEFALNKFFISID